MFRPDSDLTSFFKMLRCNINHFEVGKKCKIVFPFYLCESLGAVFLSLCSKRSLLCYCIGRVARDSLCQVLRSA